MGQLLATGVLATALAGCSLIYNPNGLPQPGSDAAPDMEVIVDADPTMLVLSDVAPATIDEGRGDGGGRAAIVVIRGDNIAPDAAVTITSQTDNTHFTVGTVELAADHKFIAVQLVAQVDDTLVAGASNMLDIHVTQALPGGGTKTVDLVGKLSITGLQELDDAFGNTAGELLPLYSRVMLTGTRTISGSKDQRALIRSASSIMVGNLVAKGANASGNNKGLGGPGGCNGGGGGAVGECSPSSGQPGQLAGALGKGGGGGGGGFGAAGTSSGVANGGAGGAEVGSDVIASYDGLAEAANRPGGGGGGGGGAVLGNGGGGGGGGGVVELTAEGDITVGTISATGGNGGNGGLTDGGGGGGAGGAIVLRAGGALTAGMLTATGGDPGGNGGGGAVGRIRFDVASGTASGSPTAHRGPAFVGAPLSVTTTTPTITMIGTANDGFKVFVIDHDGAVHDQETFSFGANNMATFTPLLFRGYNRLCVLLDGGERGKSEAEKCVDVAMLP